MQTVNIHEAKTHFSKRIERIQRGEEVVIAKTGVSLAGLSPYLRKQLKIKPPGGMQGQGFWIADDFDAPLPEDLQAAFVGRDE